MNQPTSQNPVLNYLANLPSLIAEARFFLDLQQQQGEQEEAFENLNLILRVYALNLTLISLEEFDALSFEEVFQRLNWLLEQENLLAEGPSIPPTLKELLVEHEKKKVAEKEIQEERKRFIEEAKKLAAAVKRRNQLVAALRQAELKPEEVKEIPWQTIVETLGKNEEFIISIEKIAGNPNLSSTEKEALLQEALGRVLDQQEIGPETLSAIKKIPFSLESFNFLAEKLTQSPAERTAVIEHLEKISQPLTESQIVALKEKFIPYLAAYASLTRTGDLSWEEVVKNISREQAEEFKKEGLSLEQANKVGLLLAQEAKKVLPEFPGEISAVSPAVVIIDENDKKIVLPLVSLPETKGNPWKAKDPDNQPLSYHLARLGVGPEELESLARIQQLLRGDPHSPSSQALFQLASKLKKFQAQYFPLESPRWQNARAKEILAFFKPATFIQKTALGVKNWFFKTSAGQAVKLWLRKASQKSLEALWATAKTGIKTAVTKGVTAFLTRIGLQAVANTVAPVIGGLIAFLGEKVIKEGFSLVKRVGGFVLSGFGLANVVMEGITGQREVKDTSGMGKLAMIGVGGTIGLVAVLSLFSTMNKNSGLLGRGAGGLPSTPGLPVAKLPECQAPRHLAEEVICLVTHPPCSFDQNRINWGSRGLIGPCLDNLTLIGANALVGLKEVLQYYHCYYSAPGCPSLCQPEECPLQCLQFVVAITDALGQNINLGFDYAGLYADTYPSTYRKVTDPRKGDVVVWRGDPGHIGIFIDKVPDSTSKTLVAEANFDLHGGVGIIERHGVGFESGPSVYLRYCPGGNCQ